MIVNILTNVFVKFFSKRLFPVFKKRKKTYVNTEIKTIVYKAVENREENFIVCKLPVELIWIYFQRKNL